MKDEAYQPPPSGGGGGDAASHDAWMNALLVAALFARDPTRFGGVIVRARPGPVRDAWLRRLKAHLRDDTPVRRMPIGITEDRLLGGLDITGTLNTGAPVFRNGLLTEADGGIIVAPMAERMDALTISRIAAALDTGAVRVERDGVSRTTPARFGFIAFDEGAFDEGTRPDETVSPILADRAAFLVDLSDVTLRQTAMPVSAPMVERGDVTATLTSEQLTASVALAAAFGVTSVRTLGFFVKTIAALAEIASREAPNEADIERAAALVIAPRATQMPAEDDQTEPAPDEQDEEDQPERQNENPDAMEDRLIDAIAANLSAAILDRMARGKSRRGAAKATGAGAQAVSQSRGRTVGTRRGELNGKARLHVLETLRAAAPFQRLRRTETGPTHHRLHVRAEDIRVRRFKDQRETLTIFVVDASGSTAADRLAEAKGAVECFLTRCYSRRDQVALIAFRGDHADLLLPPTRALARAKRALAGVPGGGATPLYAGLEAARALTEQAQRQGQSVNIIVFTDGSANMGRTGPGRAQAHADALDAATRLSISGASTLVIDTATRPRPKAREIANALDATYMPLPHADARTVATAVEAIAA
ncbi:MAG: magnesium chelatase subunit D [Pseudomonadota bacterium]